MNDDRTVPWGAYALLLAASFALRGVVAWEAHAGLLLAEPVGDGWAFHAEALRLAAGGFGEQQTLWQAPGTSWVLALLYSVVPEELLFWVFCPIPMTQFPMNEALRDGPHLPAPG